MKNINLLTKKEMMEYYNDINSNLSARRREYISEYGFIGITKEFIQELSKYLKDKNVLSIMSGKGYIEYLLSENNVSVKATDNNNFLNYYLLNDGGNNSWKNSFIEIENIDCIDAINKYHEWSDIILMSWPPYDNPIAYEAAYTAHKYNIPILYIGEWIGGCNADRSFFNFIDEFKEELNPEDKDVQLKLIESYFRFTGIYDSCKIIKWRSNTNETR